LHALRAYCSTYRLPLNVSDHPALSDYSFPSTHRFALSSAPTTTGNRQTDQQQQQLSTLQIAISTNGKGCRLASRLKREIVGKLPRTVGQAVENVGLLRERAKALSAQAAAAAAKGSLDTPSATAGAAATAAFEDDPSTPHVPLNSPVPQLHRRPSAGSRQPSSSYFTSALSLSASASTSASATGGLPTPTDESVAAEDPDGLEQEALRRMRWVAQMSEYWPLDALGALKPADMDGLLGRYESQRTRGGGDEGFVDGESSTPTPTTTTAAAGATSSSATSAVSGTTDSGPSAGADDGPAPSAAHDLALRPPSPPPASARGTIHLIGSGPGHPSLLTIAAHQSLLSATLVLSDKLVPAEILALIPSTTEVHIAKKYPGNAEGAQNEMMELALVGAERGERVVRLKQGDPFVYGRGGEEVLFFREHGFESTVIPGVSSALAGPLMFNIPVTQRGVAESMVLCTGVGRKGKAVTLPGFERSRTLCLLMGVARLSSVIDVLTRPSEGSLDGITGHRAGPAYPLHTPIAIVERASSPDQRMIASTLGGIVAALERVGEQRVPGMMVIGFACLALAGEGDVGVLDDGPEADEGRVEAWLSREGDGSGLVVREGMSPEWDALMAGHVAAL